MTTTRTLILLPLLALVPEQAPATVVPAADVARFRTLRAEIAHHDDLYFRDAAPEISDAVYDRLKCELLQLEQQVPRSVGAELDHLSSSPVGDDRSGIHATFRHRVSMLSLDKSHSEADVREFYARMQRMTGSERVWCVVEPKYDGVAVSLTYVKGRLVHAATRGDGNEGDDVTAHVREISELPGELRDDQTAGVVPDLIELRGEIYLPVSEFSRINRERESVGEMPFAHPRNVVAGALKQLEADEARDRNLAVVIYGWGACEPASARPATQRAFHDVVREWGLPAVDAQQLAKSADEVWSAVKAFDQKRRSFGAPTDGLVIKLDSAEAQQRLGSTSRAPRWATAFKFSPEQVEARLNAISLHIGRTGLVTPVAEFSPVRLGGATVSRASLHNVAEVMRRDFRIGDTVFVEKSGEVVPSIAGVNFARRPADARAYVCPAGCPSCGAEFADAGFGAVLRCPNYLCPEQVRRRVQHFTSDNCMGISGLGPRTIDTLVSGELVKTVADLYRLTREDLISRIPASSSGKSWESLLDAISHSKDVELWRIINGLGMPHVGVSAAKDLAKRFEDLGMLLRVAIGDQPTSRGEWATLRPAVASSVLEYFSDLRNRDLVRDLVALGVTGKSRRAADEGGANMTARAEALPDGAIAETDPGDTPSRSFRQNLMERGGGDAGAGRPIVDEIFGDEMGEG